MNERTDPYTSNATSARPSAHDCAPSAPRRAVADATTIATAAISDNNDPTRVRRAFLEPSSQISGVSSSVIVP